MAYSSIVKPSDYFNTVLYTGTGSSNAVTGVGFQPDWIWIKNRAEAQDHALFDAVRGASGGYYGKIRSNTTSIQEYDSNGMSAIGSDGFTVIDNDQVNKNNINYASWNWKANGAGSSNTDGNITSTVSANTTAGFSIVKYTGNSGGSGYSATVGHGLGVAPKMIFVKCISHSAEWNVYYGDATDFLILNETNATADDDTRWYDTAPTNSVFTLGINSNVNNVGRDYIAYCFTDVTGYSKIGTYTGNGNADGTFVYTGLAPAFVFVKRTDGIDNWFINDNKRNPFNEAENPIRPNLNSEEYGGTGYGIDMLSNGFKVRTADAGFNASGGNYIYMVIAEQPLVANSGTDGVPATAI